MSDVMLDRKVKRVCELRLDDPELVEALEVVREFWTENTAEARRNLRGDLERKSLEMVEGFLGSFDAVRHALVAVERRAGELEERVSVVASQVVGADEASRKLCAEYEALSKREEELQTRRQEAEQVLSKYKLRTDEVAVLESGDLEDRAVAARFFDALERARKGRESAEGSLEGEGNLSPAAIFGMVEALGAQHEHALARLYEWTVAQLDKPEAAAALEDDAHPLRRALQALALREAYDCTELALQQRCAAVANRFGRALTVGDRAIEHNRSDAFRYVSDVLAWAHEALASEKEIGLSVEPVADALAKLLTQRVYDTIRGAAEDAVVLYRLCGVLDFYSTLFMTEPLTECKKEAQRACEARVQRARDTLANSSVADFVVATEDESSGLADDRWYRRSRNDDGKASDILKSAVKLVVDLLAVDQVNQSDGAAPLASSLLEPLYQKLDTCLYAQRDFLTLDFIGQETKTSLTRADLGKAYDWSESDACVFVANAAGAAANMLKPLSAPSNFLDIAKRALDALAAQEASALLRRCKLDAILDRARRAKLIGGGEDVLDALGGPAARAIPAGDLAAALRAFYSSLFSSATPELKALVDPHHRAQARKAIARRLADAHATVHAFASDPVLGGYDDLAFLVHTPRQVKVLLDVDDLDER